MSVSTQFHGIGNEAPNYDNVNKKHVVLDPEISYFRPLQSIIQRHHNAHSSRFCTAWDATGVDFRRPTISVLIWIVLSVRLPRNTQSENITTICLITWIIFNWTINYHTCILVPESWTMDRCRCRQTMSWSNFSHEASAMNITKSFKYIEVV